jgi:hypothetical protein
MMRYIVEEVSLEKVETDGKTVYHAVLGQGSYFRPDIHIWIKDPSIITVGKDGSPYLLFPLKGRIIPLDEKKEENEKIKHYMIEPDPASTIWNVFVESGFRGGASITVKEGNPEMVVEYDHYESELGSTGRSKGALIQLKEKVVLEIERWGRTYGEPSRAVIVLTPQRYIVLDHINYQLYQVLRRG